MKLRFYRELIKELIRNDNWNKDDETHDADVHHVGNVHFDLPPFAKGEPSNIPFYLEVGGKVGCAYLCLFENGERAIVMDRDYFVNTNYDRIKAVIAHEIGHLICQHYKHPSYGRQLNVRTDKLERLSYKASQSDHSKDTMNYMRAVMFSLIRGGCVTREVEADMAATLYTSVDSLIAVHSEDLTHPNPTAVLEKTNRLKWLNEFKKHDPEKKLNLEIKLKPTKAKKVKVDV